jgi:hypothetical protein
MGADTAQALAGLIALETGQKALIAPTLQAVSDVRPALLLVDGEELAGTARSSFPMAAVVDVAVARMSGGEGPIDASQVIRDIARALFISNEPDLL